MGIDDGINRPVFVLNGSEEIINTNKAGNPKCSIKLLNSTLVRIDCATVSVDALRHLLRLIDTALNTSEIKLQ